MDIDVVIIGGGPAGISAGVILKKKGYSCIIIDKAAFPRDKLCGGVLTQKTINKINAIYGKKLYDRLNTNHIDCLEVFDGNKMAARYNLKYGFTTVERKEMDQELMNYYLHIGGVLFESQSKYIINYESNKILLEDGQVINYKILIGADGINSKVRKYVTDTRIPQIFCFEKFIPIDNLHPRDKISIYFGIAHSGYAWKIPSYRNIGIGMGELKIVNSKTTYKKFLKYCQSSDVTGSEGIKGAAVSCGLYIRKPIRNNVLLVGDAAQLIDGITGEGIYFAIYSAEIAAYTVDQYLKTGVSLTNYVKSIRRIHAIMNEHNFYNKLLFCPFSQKLVLTYIKANQGFAQTIFDDVISNYHISYTKALVEWQKNLVRKFYFKK